MITYAIACCMEKKAPHPLEAVALLVLCTGVMVTVWAGPMSWNAGGILLCLSSTVCTASMMSISGHVLCGSLDILHLNLYTAPIAFATLMPVFMVQEVSCCCGQVSKLQNHQDT